jgi:8-hydroxy-5-deazaflavin:NADPH oxidoreductase
MRIAVIGAGNVGSTLGQAWSRRRHDVVFGVRDPKAAKLREPARVATNAEAARASDVVVLATPWKDTEVAVRSCGDLRGKAVVDCTNPLTPDASGLVLGLTTSGAEQVASWATGAEVFKAMNQVGFRLMDGPTFPAAVKPVMFVCGDGARKPEILRLVAELGFDTIDAGALTIARLLEPYAMLWIHLALKGLVQGDFAFALLRK